MKVSINDEELFTMTEIQKKVIKNDVHEDEFDKDMKRRLKWILIDEKYQKCLKRLKDEWVPIIKERYETLPTNDEVLADLILSQPDYKNRSQREEELLPR